MREEREEERAFVSAATARGRVDVVRVGGGSLVGRVKIVV